MKDSNLSANLSDAWLGKAKAARAELMHAEKAPALFKPEFIERAQGEFVRAMAQVDYWQRQAVSA